MGNTLRIATRTSQLANIQTARVREKIQANCPGIQVEIVPCSTRGDEILDRPLADVGGKGLFIKTLEDALLAGKADIAVHSLKDVPSVLEAPFCLPAYVERESPWDVLVSARYATLAELPAGARVGTSSPRRSAQLRRWRPDIEPVLLRGNVPTRLRKISEGEMDAAILAEAGLARLGELAQVREVFSLQTLMPAPGQGIVAVECLASRAAELSDVMRALNDASIERQALAERAVATRLQGNCHSPIGAYAEIREAELVLHGGVFSPEGLGAIEVSASLALSAAHPDACVDLGSAVAERLLAKGAQAWL